MGSQNRQLRFPNLIPSTRTLNQRQDASLRHFHRVTKSLRVPTGYTFLNRLSYPDDPSLIDVTTYYLNHPITHTLVAIFNPEPSLKTS